MKNAIIVLATLLAASLLGIYLLASENRRLRSLPPTVVTKVEWVHDTVQGPIPEPIVKTVKERIPVPVHDTTIIFRDSLILLPIETKTYATADYKATISGYQPRLLDIEIYRSTPMVTTSFTGAAPAAESKSPGPRIHLDLGVGGGVGYDPVSKSWHPVVNVSLYIPVVRFF